MFDYKENLTLKKTVLYITLTILIAAMLLPAAALADMNVSLILSNDAPEFSAPGDEFSVILHIKGSYEVHAANLSVDYDPASLEVQSAEKCEFLKNEASDKGAIVVLDEKKLAAKGQVKFGFAFPMEGLKGEGDLVKISFKIKEGVKEHQQVILTVYEFGYMPASETSATPIPFTTENTVIHIKSGSDPSYGYNPGETGIPDPLMTQRPHPAIDAVSTAKPQDTEAPSTENPGENPGTETEKPDAPENTEAPAASASPAPSKPDSDKDKKKDNTIVFVIAGVVAAAAIVVLILTRKKKHTK